MRRSAASLGLLLAALLGITVAHAETVTILARQPATYVEASLLRKIVLTDLAGNGGSVLTAALRQQFMTAGPDNQPYFTLVSSGRGGGIGIMSGDVTLNSDASAHIERRTRCIESAGLFNCRRSETYNVQCYQRVDTVILNLRIVRASDRNVVYAATKSYPQTRRWCDGSAPPQPLEVDLAESASDISSKIFSEVAPHTVSYRVRLLETTKGLSKPASSAFKAAVLISTRDMVSSCAQWNAIAAERASSAALEFDLGLCAEQAGNLAEAEASYARAMVLLPGNTTIAEGTSRVRGLIAANTAVAAQLSRRAIAVAAEQREAAATDRSRRADEAAAQRLVRQRSAAVQAVKTERRQAVVHQYGAVAADAILSGNVRAGMNKDQVRAAVGGGCRVQSLGQGEEQWFCGAKRIVFSGGKVVLVR